MLQFGQNASKIQYGNVVYNLATGSIASDDAVSLDLSAITTTDSDMNISTNNKEYRIINVLPASDDTTVHADVEITLMNPMEVPNQFISIRSAGFEADVDMTVKDPTEFLGGADGTEFDGTKSISLLYYSDGMSWHQVAAADTDTG